MSNTDNRESNKGIFTIVTQAEIDRENILKTQANNSVKYVNGADCETKESLLREWSTVLSFPPYFNLNWDSFDECFNDMSWLNESHLTIIIKNFDRLLAKDIKEFKLFMSILRETVHNWEEKSKKLSIMILT